MFAQCMTTTFGTLKSVGSVANTARLLKGIRAVEHSCFALSLFLKKS